MYRCYFLPVGQISAQLAACSLRVVVRSLVADEALFAEQLCAVLLDALAGAAAAIVPCAEMDAAKLNEYDVVAF